MKIFHLALTFAGFQAAAASQEQIPIQLPLVAEKGLLTEEISSKSILDEHDKYSKKMAHSRLFKSGNLLGYVTPWASKGYDYAKTFRGKFTHIAPVWFTIKRIGVENYEIQGEHDVDVKWLNEIKYGNDRYDPSGDGIVVPLIVPRFRSDFGQEDYYEFTADSPNVKKEAAAVAQAIFNICKKYKFDGALLELAYPQYIFSIVYAVSDLLHSADMIVIITVPALLKQRNDVIKFDAAAVEMVNEIVDGFNLMTYDFTSGTNLGPIAPIDWIKEEVETMCPDPEIRKKFFVGLNFYGYDYNKGKGATHVIGSTFIQQVKTMTPFFKWLPQFAEHFFAYTHGKDTHYVFYPSLLSIDARIQLAEELGVGIGIWELGQGLEYFVFYVFIYIHLTVV